MGEEMASLKRQLDRQKMLHLDEMDKMKQSFATQMRGLDHMNRDLAGRNQELELLVSDRERALDTLRVEYERLEKDIQNNVSNAIGRTIVLQNSGYPSGPGVPPPRPPPGAAM